MDVLDKNNLLKDALNDGFFKFPSAVSEPKNKTYKSFPFGNQSVFYKPPENSLRQYLEKSNKYSRFSSKYPELDSEQIFIHEGKFPPNVDLPGFMKSRILRIVEHKSRFIQDYFLRVIEEGLVRGSSYSDNFTWFLEGESSSTVTFHFFISESGIIDIVCNIGSDILDAIKINFKFDDSIGYEVELDGNIRINPVLNEFKMQILEWVRKVYLQGNVFDKTYPIPIDIFYDAMDREFTAESDYQKSTDFVFDRLGITGAFKEIVNQFKEYSQKIENYKLEENRYLPYVPNYDPLFSDSLLRALGVNPMVDINDYFSDIDKEDIEKFQLLEKEVNWIHGYNAGFCGIWNALVDTVDGFTLLIPSLYEVFTDRAKLKLFLHSIKEIIDHIGVIWEKIEEWELENSSFSVYRYEYFQCYAITMVLALFLPTPKGSGNAKLVEIFDFLGAANKLLTEREIIQLAFKAGLRIEKTGNTWTLFVEEVATTAASKQKIAQRIEELTKGQTIPIEVSLGVSTDALQFMRQMQLQIKINLKTVDLIKSGELFFRLTIDDLSKFINFFKLRKAERIKLIKHATLVLKESSAKYNKSLAKAKGFDVSVSKNGLAPDFAGTPYLYNENSIVKIRLTGNYELDFTRAFEKMGITEKSVMLQIREEYVWHHLDDLDENLVSTFQLVSKEAHAATIRHIGSCGQVKKATAIKKIY